MSNVRGGQKFEAALREIAEMLGDGGGVKIGFLENATYPRGTPVALVAAIHNYGRWPFFTKMVNDKSHEWPAAIGAALVRNKYDVERTLEQVGQAIAGQLRQSIVDTVSPPNAPSTIRRKGFDKPLVETGHLLNSVDYEVKT